MSPGAKVAGIHRFGHKVMVVQVPAWDDGSRAGRTRGPGEKRGTRLTD